MIDFHQILERFDRRSGATTSAIRASEELLGHEFPEDYVEFLTLTNGGEGFIGEKAYVMLWSVEELAPLNEAYDIRKHVHGLLLFGSDGGGEAYAFDTRMPQWSVIQLPFIGADWKVAIPSGDSFSAFLAALYASE